MLRRGHCVFRRRWRRFVDRHELRRHMINQPHAVDGPEEVCDAEGEHTGSPNVEYDRLASSSAHRSCGLDLVAQVHELPRACLQPHPQDLGHGPADGPVEEPVGRFRRRQAEVDVHAVAMIRSDPVTAGVYREPSLGTPLDEVSQLSLREWQSPSMQPSQQVGNRDPTPGIEVHAGGRRIVPQDVGESLRHGREVDVRRRRGVAAA